ncbi:helix-turn-helix transcriptional regulator [Anaeromassilibacillus senegalensis]|uniref:helix-turn-helix transcriptional regulator n=1 Tax=Anaeromassilibacillus senegalensis TaxID=1673717 RepID=UPI0006820B5C|nr:helix-turn-helix transcriptional regulator [Anaeromassilibacillus senegalensis]
MNIEDFGPRLRWLRRLREARGMSVNQFAEKAGVNRTTILYLEGGRSRYPRVDTMIMLADLFGIALDELVGRNINCTTPNT